ncbi:MAG: PQQ-binding-like beta-propeller repeat protein [Myxococcota bacterium]
MTPTTPPAPEGSLAIEASAPLTTEALRPLPEVPPYPGDDVLDAARAASRPATAPAWGPDRALAAPADHHALPGSVVRWRREFPFSPGYVGAVGGLLFVRSGRDQLVAHDLATGERAWSVAFRAGGFLLSVLPGCDGRSVVAVSTLEIAALSVRTGRRRWSRRFDEPRERVVHGFDDAGPPAVAGCHLAYLQEEGARVLVSGGVEELVIRNTRTGRVVRRHRCQDGCNAIARFPNRRGFIVEGQRHAELVPVRGPVRTLPLQSIAVTGEGASLSLPSWADMQGLTYRLYGAAVGVDTDGTKQWGDPAWRQVLGLEGEDVVGRTDDGVERRGLRHGDLRWRASLRFAGRPHASVSDARRVIVSADSPPLLFEVDAESGEPRGLRLAPLRPEALVLVGDTLLLRGRNELVAVDLTRETPPMRHVVPLLSDVNAALETVIANYDQEPSDRRHSRRSEAGRRGAWAASRA